MRCLPVSDERGCGKITFNSKVHFEAWAGFLRCGMTDLGLSVGQRLGDGWMGVVEVGKSLERTVKHFNGFVGSIEHSVMSQARKFHELEVEGTQDLLPELASVDTETRHVRQDRDLVVAEATVQDLLSSEVV